jgi:pyruvate-formate lyase-activating enzyme
MTLKMKHSHSVDFLNQEHIDLNFIVDELLNDKNLDSDLCNYIVKNIKKVVGNQEIQWISRNGTEHLVEYIVHRFRFKNYPRLKKLEPIPLHLLIEPTSVCNLRCKMCFQSDRSFQTREYLGMMDFELFKNLVDQAVENNCKSLTLASRGEPTLHREFGKMLEYCKGKFLELKINTNATRLSEELSYVILDAGVDIVVFSIDSYYKEEYEKIRVGGDFRIVFKNIERFHEIKLSKDKYRKTSTRVSGVYLGEEQSKEKFLNFWKEIVDDVTFSDVVTRWDTYNNDLMSFSKPCEYLWERMYVWYDGTCNPCDYDYKSRLKVGDAKKTPLKDVWMGKTYNRYRNMFLQGERGLIDPCNKCNIY